MLRQGFASYVEVFRNVSVVYGSFAFALLFMISIELTWTIILFGSEAAYTAQHFPCCARGLHRHPPVQASLGGPGRPGPDRPPLRTAASPPSPARPWRTA